MAFVGKTNVVQANLRFTLLDQQIENTLYFRFLGEAVSPSDMNNLGVDLITWWTGNLQNNLVDNLVFREVYLTDLSTQTAPTVTVTAGLPLVGTVTADPLSNNVALCVSFRTNGRGRSARGRNYISGFGEDSVTGNTVNATVAENIRGFYEDLMDTLTLGSAFEWVVYSRFENGVPRTEGLDQLVTAVVLTDLTVDSQRRRLPGRGR